MTVTLPTIKVTFNQALVVSRDLGYLVTYAGFDLTTFASLTTLRTFNPLTGVLNADPVEGFVNVDITTLAQAPDGKIWVGLNGAAPGFAIIDPVTGLVEAEQIATPLVPINVVFLTSPGGS